MKFEFIKKIRLQNIILFTIGLIGFVCTMYVDKNYLHIHVFQYGMPNFGSEYVMRMFAIFLFTALIFYALLKTSHRKQSEKNTLLKPSAYWDYWAITSIVMLSLSFMFLLLFKPIFFHELSQEDNIIEWGSALFLFAASFVFLMTWIKEHNLSYAFKHFKWLCLVFSLVFFVIAMEEISWFQRIIEFDTPEAFGSNLQNEANLHNFNTNYSENLYYFGSFAFLVLLPYFEFLFPKIITNKHLKSYIPRPLIAVIATVPCAYNFDRWDALTTQFTVFSCILILGSFLLFAFGKKEKRILSLFLAFFIFQQLVFLMSGTNYLGIYDVKEYKEFLIPLCFFIYSIDRFGSFKK